VHLAVLDGLEVVYVERRESPGAVRMFGRIGNRGLAHSTASGKVLLAFLPQAELDRRLAGVRLARRTPTRSPARTGSELSCSGSVRAAGRRT